MDWKDTEAQLKCSGDTTQQASNQAFFQAFRKANLGEFRKIATDCIKLLQKAIVLEEWKKWV